MPYFLHHVSVHPSVFFLMCVKVVDIYTWILSFVASISLSKLLVLEVKFTVNWTNINLMSFDIQLCNPNPLYKLWNISITSENFCSQFLYLSHPFLLGFCLHHRLVWPILELHRNGISMYYCVNFFLSACVEIHLCV